jgi:hypothetical protein
MMISAVRFGGLTKDPKAITWAGIALRKTFNLSEPALQWNFGLRKFDIFANIAV